MPQLSRDRLPHHALTSLLHVSSAFSQRIPKLYRLFGDIISLIMFDLRTLAILSLHISLLRSGSSWTFPPKNKSQWESLKNKSRPPHLIHHHYMKLARLVDSSVVGPITNHPSGEKSQHVRIKLPFVYVSLLVCIRFCAHPALTYLWTWPLSYMLWPYLGH